MVLIECYVENFGVLHQFRYRPKPGLNVLYRGNGEGKSTFAAFIRAMFYGLPNTGNRKNLAEAERRKYEPWQQGPFGGTVRFQAGSKTYRLERTFGARDKEDTFLLTDEQTGLVSLDFPGNIGEALFGVDRDAFTSTAWIAHTALPVRVNDSIHAKLGVVTAFDSDIGSYEAAVQKLEREQKQYRRTGRRGLIYEREELLAALEEECYALEKRQRALQDRIPDRPAKAGPQTAGSARPADLNAAELKRLAWLDDYFSAGFAEEDELIGLQQENEKALAAAVQANRSAARGRLLYFVPAALFLAAAGFAAAGRAYLPAVAAGLCAAALLDGAIYQNRVWRKTSRQCAELEKNGERLYKEQALQKEYHRLSDREQFNQRVAAEVERQVSMEQQRQSAAAQERETAEIAERLLRLRAQQAQCRQELASYRQRVEVLEKTRQYLETARDTYTQGYMGKVSQHFMRFLALFDERLARSVSLDARFGLRYAPNRVTREIGHLSSGLMDIVWLCERLAVIEAVYGDAKPVLILDDPFANLDDTMQQRAFSLLEQVSGRQQILYLTCHHPVFQRKTL